MKYNFCLEKFIFCYFALFEIFIPIGIQGHRTYCIVQNITFCNLVSESNCCLKVLRDVFKMHCQPDVKKFFKKCQQSGICAFRNFYKEIFQAKKENIDKRLVT